MSGRQTDGSSEEAPAELPYPVSEAKRALRTRMREVRGTVGEAEREALAKTLAASLLGELAADATVRLSAMALYAAKDDEAPVDSLVELAADGGFIAYPRVATKSTLAFHLVSGPSDLEPAAFGLREPRPDAPEVLPGALKLIIIPGLAFDRAGCRLGWGGGYYDDALLHHPDALRIGVAYQKQIIDRVPTEAWDVPVDRIITEEGVIQCRPYI